MSIELSGKNAAVGIILLIIIVAVVLSTGILKKESADSAAVRAEGALQKLEKASDVSAPSVPTSANPIRQVLPSENPLEKANPFKKTYVNPFE